MTRLLLRLFVRNADQTGDPKVRSAYGVLSGAVGILCNFLLFAGKLAVGTISGSVSVTADAVNNLSDASSSIVTLVGFRIAEKTGGRRTSLRPCQGGVSFRAGCGRADSDHRRGAGENLCGKIFHPSPVEFSPVVGAVLVLSILVKLWMALFNRDLGRRIDSAALQATSMDSRNDVISTGAVFLAALVENWTGWTIDGYVGLLVALFIIWSGVGIARDTVDPLLGNRWILPSGRSLPERSSKAIRYWAFTI